MRKCTKITKDVQRIMKIKDEPRPRLQIGQTDGHALRQLLSTKQLDRLSKATDALRGDKSYKSRHNAPQGMRRSCSQRILDHSEGKQTDEHHTYHPCLTNLETTQAQCGIYFKRY